MGVVEFEKRGHIALVTLNRPEALNALNAEVQAGLRAAWAEVESDEEIRVAILTGTGRAFSAGADLKSMEGRPPDPGVQMPGAGPSPSVSSVTYPLIAVINGYCLAGAMELATACDLRIASSNAQVARPR